MSWVLDYESDGLFLHFPEEETDSVKAGSFYKLYDFDRVEFSKGNRYKAGFKHNHSSRRFGLSLSVSCHKLSRLSTLPFASR